jgi:hypothetical protein
MIDLEAPACRANVLDSPSEDSLAYQTLMLEKHGATNERPDSDDIYLFRICLL